MNKPENSAVIEAIGLSKFYGPFAAISDVSFQIPRGQVAAFLGPNGAGKSTTMKCLTGFLAPTHGTAKIGGHDVLEDRMAAAKMIGYLPENGPLYAEMTPQSFLKYMGEARGLKRQQLKDRLDYVVEQCALGGVYGKAISKLSKGYRQRVGMAQALLHDPEVLILDEPTAGLDPNQIHQVRDLITRLSETKTILLSTHILQEVEAIAGRVVFIFNGRIVFDGTVAEMAAGGDMEAKFRELTTTAA
ncbi:ABC transporter ATP-binding protein [Symmachiella dynata]|uniref:Putative ABC transporter ATP-binding protein YxlF n=1 Tax=Symmachiella dynata TaxID=2527995 RepID=A0A517ZUT9_9PLAN|nr:ATP-binding cassette domain-containing protein [Symmachiella dynata]QDT50577.1 putative ABC transporter ATP-binding protein YxlF [Symmachiella dynata]QDU46230.1 putative ABC transporter ATP-binding protein YxlF [Symmachiella dynata]